jgi:hypothetical protein
MRQFHAVGVVLEAGLSVHEGLFGLVVALWLAALVRLVPWVRPVVQLQVRKVCVYYEVIVSSLHAR